VDFQRCGHCGSERRQQLLGSFAIAEIVFAGTSVSRMRVEELP
jgi:hypothetical protein